MLFLSVQWRKYFGSFVGEFYHTTKWPLGENGGQAPKQETGKRVDCSEFKVCSFVMYKLSVFFFKYKYPRVLS